MATERKVYLVQDAGSSDSWCVDAKSEVHAAGQVFAHLEGLDTTETPAPMPVLQVTEWTVMV